MPPVTDFVPARIDATRWEEIEPLLRALLDRPVGSAKAFERWLLDRSELEAACGEAETRGAQRATSASVNAVNAPTIGNESDGISSTAGSS